MGLVLVLIFQSSYNFEKLMSCKGEIFLCLSQFSRMLFQKRGERHEGMGEKC